MWFVRDPCRLGDPLPALPPEGGPAFSVRGCRRIGGSEGPEGPAQRAGAEGAASSPPRQGGRRGIVTTVTSHFQKLEKILDAHIPKRQDSLSPESLSIIPAQNVPPLPSEVSGCITSRRRFQPGRDACSRPGNRTPAPPRPERPAARAGAGGVQVGRGAGLAAACGCSARSWASEDSRRATDQAPHAARGPPRPPPSDPAAWEPRAETWRFQAVDGGGCKVTEGGRPAGPLAA